MLFNYRDGQLEGGGLNGASEMVRKGPCVDVCQFAHLFLVTKSQPENVGQIIIRVNMSMLSSKLVQ